MSLPDQTAGSAASVEAKNLRPSAVSLPPVEAPTGSFILQLFLIPLLIVSLIVLLWLAFSWLGGRGDSDPKQLVAELGKGSEHSWQRAYELAERLRNPDPRHDALRQDHEFAQKLAAILDDDSRASAAAQETFSPAASWQMGVRAKRRLFLCRALGAFQVTDGLPALVRCAAQDRGALDAEVRLSALEAIALLASSAGGEKILECPDAAPTLLACSRLDDGADSPVAGDYSPPREIRAVAAYALGVIGGEAGRQRLVEMLLDSYSNARYNAATGLARQGDARAIPVLQEMLDPHNSLAGKDETWDADRQRKRTTVLFNGVKASLLLLKKNHQAPREELQKSLAALAAADLANITIDRANLKSAAADAAAKLSAP